MNEAKPVHRGADHRRSARAGIRDERGGGMPQARHITAELVCLEGEVRGHERFGCQAAETARAGKRQAQEAAGGSDAGPCGVEGHHLAKVVTPAARRVAVSLALEASASGGPVRSSAL